MDGFSNPFLPAIWSHHNNASHRIFSDQAALDPPATIPNGQDGFVSSSLLVSNQGMRLNAGSTILPTTNPVLQGGTASELTTLPLPNLDGVQFFSSNPAIWAPTFPDSDISSYKDLIQCNNEAPNSFGNMQQLTNFDGRNGVNGLNITSFASESNFSFTRTLQLPQQANTQLSTGSHNLTLVPETQANITQITATTNGGFDGTFKPRVRAKRGHATDPHSIAERHRREKIAERMKNLQELVPNTNKTDKASMLDEIIGYVRFLQLQVKVLSMSRLGATEAVVPLLTESETEGSNGVMSSVPVGSTASVSMDGTAELQNSAAYEREVMQLMESNMTSAMQYLQNKGLCLMPIALASAISIQKGIRKATIPSEI